MNYKHIILFFILCSIVGTASAAIASFTASPTTGIAPLSVSFNDQSTGAIKWKWDFGDGMVVIVNGGSSGSTSYTYSNPGTYTAVLTVNDGATKTRTILVTAPTTIPTPIPTTVPTTIPTPVSTTTIITTPVPTFGTTTTTVIPQTTTPIITTIPYTQTPTYAPTSTPIQTPIQTTTPAMPPTETYIAPSPEIIYSFVPTPEPIEQPTISIPESTPIIYRDSVVDIVSPWLPFINRGQTMVKFQIGDVIYVIRRG